MFSLPGQHGHHPTKHVNGATASPETVYDTKYKILTRKCLQVKEETDRIYGNLLRSKKLLRRLLHERRLLAERLERYNDPFCDVDIPKFCDEDFAYELLISQKNSINEMTSPATPTSLGSASTSASRRGSSSSQPILQTPPLMSGSFFDNGEPGSASKSKKKSTSGTPRAKKDPEAPRKPVNAYFIFCERRRADVQRQMVEERQGDVDRKEVTRKLSQLWLDLPQEEKKAFYTLYEIEKSRYDAEMKEYSATRQPLSSTLSSTVLMGLPPPFHSAEEDALLNDQPIAKRPKKSSTSRNGPGRPSQSGSGMTTPTVPSNDCSLSPSNNNDGSNICIGADALLASTSEPNVVGVDESLANNIHLQQSAEDVFLLDTNGDGMECLGLPLASEAVGGTLLLSSTTTADESSGESVSAGLANGNGTASEHHSSSTGSPPSASIQHTLPILQQQGIILDGSPQQPSPPTSNDWQSSLPVTAVVVMQSSSTEEGDHNNASSSSTLSPPPVNFVCEPSAVIAENEAALPVPEPPDPEHQFDNDKNNDSATAVFEDAQEEVEKKVKEPSLQMEIVPNPEQIKVEERILEAVPEPAIVDETPAVGTEQLQMLVEPKSAKIQATNGPTTNGIGKINVADIPLPPDPPNFCFGVVPPPPPPPPTV